MRKLLLTLLLFSFYGLRSQIICTDIIPDQVCTGNNTLNIDMDNDLTPDFRITSAQAGPLGFVVVQGGQIGVNNFVLTNGSGDTQALPLSVPVNSMSMSWTQMSSSNQVMVTVSNTTVTGPWAGAIDQYLGVQFVSGNTIHFGWILFSFSNAANTFTVKEYAYNGQNNAEIFTGEACTTIGNPIFFMPVSGCAGESTTLTALTGTAAATGFSWTELPAPSPFSTSSVTPYSFPGPGTYTVMLTVESGSVVGSTTKTVTVYPVPPIATFGSTVCANQTLTFSAISLPASTFTWSGPNNYYSVLQTPTINNPGPSQSGIYIVTVTSLPGCTNMAYADVTVTAVPTLTLTSSSPACPGGTLSLLAVGATSYSWSGPASFTSAAGNPVIFGMNATLAGIYTVTGVTGPCVVSKTTSVTLHPPPSFTASNNGPVCEGNNAIFTASSQSVTAWLWSGPSGFVNTGQTVISFSVTPAANGFYTLAVTDANGCKATGTTFLSVLQNPVITASDATVCAGETVELVATGAQSYSWVSSNGIFTSTTSTVSIPPSGHPSTTNMTITGTAANSCTSSVFIVVENTDCTSIREFNTSKVLAIGVADEGTSLLVYSRQNFSGRVTIVDLKGRIVKAEEISLNSSESKKISTAELGSGMYIVKVETGDSKIQTFKFIRN
jgi:hypothetical protein